MLIGRSVMAFMAAAVIAGAAAAAPPERHPLPPFHEIRLQGGAEVTVVQGDVEAIAIEVSGRSIVHAEVQSGVLEIDARDDRRWWGALVGGVGHRSPRITVWLRNLDTIDASGGINVSAERLRADTLTVTFSGAATLNVATLEARTLAVDGSGAFKATLAGRVDEQKLSISGAADYRGLELASEHAAISVSGAGRVLVNVQKTLDVELSGAGKVEYKGDPKVTQRVSGAARVRRYEG